LAAAGKVTKNIDNLRSKARRAHPSMNWQIFTRTWFDIHRCLICMLMWWNNHCPAMYIRISAEALPEWVMQYAWSSLYPFNVNVHCSMRIDIRDSDHWWHLMAFISTALPSHLWEALKVNLTLCMSGIMHLETTDSLSVLGKSQFTVIHFFWYNCHCTQVCNAVSYISGVLNQPDIYRRGMMLPMMSNPATWKGMMGQVNYNQILPYLSQEAQEHWCLWVIMPGLCRCVQCLMWGGMFVTLVNLFIVSHTGMYIQLEIFLPAEYDMRSQQIHYLATMHHQSIHSSRWSSTSTFTRRCIATAKTKPFAL